MHTRKSGRTSPLLHNPEIEKSAKANRKATKASRSAPTPPVVTEPLILEELEVPTPNEEMGDADPRTVDSYYRPGVYTDASPIAYAAAPANNANRRFEARPQLISILPTFRGSASEEPYEHLREFVEICATNQVNGFSEDEIRLRLFPYSLKDKAKRWFLALRAGSITTWAEMKKQFLEEFYPIGKTSDVRNQIKSFRQIPNELFHEVFERFQELLRSCPHHEVPMWELVKVFYDGLDSGNRQLLLAASGGVFLTRTSEEEWAFFEKLSKGSKTQASVDRRSQPSSQVHAVTNSGNYENSIKSDLNAINRRLDLIFQNPGNGSMNVSQVQEVCATCGDPEHFESSCPIWMPPNREEQVNEVQGRRYDPYSNTYNPGWRDHPNFRWSGDNALNPPVQNQQNPQPKVFQPRPQQNYQNHGNFQRPPQNYGQQQYSNQPRPFQNQSQGSFQTQNHNAPQMSVMESKLDVFMEEMRKVSQSTRQQVEANTKSIGVLERQLGQLAEHITRREDGKLPSYPDLNPEHKPQTTGHVNMIGSLRNGKLYDNKVNVSDNSTNRYTQCESSPFNGTPKVGNDDKFESEKGEDNINEKILETPLRSQYVESGVDINSAPFPAAFEPPVPPTYGKKGPKSDEIWELFKQVKMNIPLLEAIKQIPAYSKFLKDLCTQKRKLKSSTPTKVKLTEQVSAVISGSLPLKLKDPGTPLIPITVGNIYNKKALLDLGASINILPSSLVDKYELGTLKHTNMVIQLADRSQKIPRGVLEDVIVKVEDFYYPVDFIVMDTDSSFTDINPTIILGRPFLATIDARINCRSGAMDMTFGNKRLRINIFNSLPSNNMNDCYVVNTTKQGTSDVFELFCAENIEPLNIEEVNAEKTDEKGTKKRRLECVVTNGVGENKEKEIPKARRKSKKRKRKGRKLEVPDVERQRVTMGDQVWMKHEEDTTELKKKGCKHPTRPP